MKALRPVPRAMLWMSDLVTFLLGNLEERLFIKCFENFRRRAVKIAVLFRELAPKLSLLTAWRRGSGLCCPLLVTIRSCAVFLRRVRALSSGLWGLRLNCASGSQRVRQGTQVYTPVPPSSAKTFDSMGLRQDLGIFTFQRASVVMM